MKKAGIIDTVYIGFSRKGLKVKTSIHFYQMISPHSRFPQGHCNSNQQSKKRTLNLPNAKMVSEARNNISDSRGRTYKT